MAESYPECFCFVQNVTHLQLRFPIWCIQELGKAQAHYIKMKLLEWLVDKWQKTPAPRKYRFLPGVYPFPMLTSLVKGKLGHLDTFSAGQYCKKKKIARLLQQLLFTMKPLFCLYFRSYPPEILIRA